MPIDQANDHAILETRSPSSWGPEQQTKFHIEIMDDQKWQDMIQGHSNLSDDEEQAIADTIKKFQGVRNGTREDDLIQSFWDVVDKLDVEISCIGQTRRARKADEHSLASSSDIDDGSDDLDMEIDALRQDFDEESLSSLFSNLSVSPDRDAGMSDFDAEDFQSDSDADDVTYAPEGTSSGLLEASTQEMRLFFLAAIGHAARRVTRIATGSQYLQVLVKNGKQAYKSTNDGRYFFYGRGGKVGGAEAFGVEDKRLVAYQHQFQKFQLQVAGELIATATQQRLNLRVPDEVFRHYLKQHPLYENAPRESRGVFYLAFAHHYMHLVFADVSGDYLLGIQRGRLMASQTLPVHWTRRLHMKEDLPEVIRMVLTLLFKQQDMWRSGRSHWVPFMYHNEAFDF